MEVMDGSRCSLKHSFRSDLSPYSLELIGKNVVVTSVKASSVPGFSLAIKAHDGVVELGGKMKTTTSTSNLVALVELEQRVNSFWNPACLGIGRWGLSDSI